MKSNNKRPAWLLAVLIGLVFILAACQTSAPANTATSVVPTDTTAPTEAPVELATEAPVEIPTPVLLEGAITTASGLQYLETFPGEGSAPESGNIITMHFIATLADGTELANTYTQQQPATAVWGKGRLLPGWEEGLGLMKAGGKAQMVMPAELAFGAQAASSLPPGSQVFFDVELISISLAPDPTDVNEDQMIATESGLMYYDLVEGKGTEAVKNGTVSTLYAMWSKSESESGYDYVDQSASNLPVTFVVGRGDVVFPGWEEGVLGMKVGGKRLLVIPPALGMGLQGSSIIPADAVIVMEIELTDANEPQIAAKVDEADYTTTESGLKYYDLKAGSGLAPTTGQTVVVHYTGWLEDGTQFDSSLDRGEPFSFQLGTGSVIPGWDEGVASMKVGGKRQLVIPSDLGYGESGAGEVIPPGATLIFEVELLDVITAGQ